MREDVRPQTRHVQKHLKDHVGPVLVRVLCHAVKSLETLAYGLDLLLLLCVCECGKIIGKLRCV